jgi:hypothetical protein
MKRATITLIALLICVFSQAQSTIAKLERLNNRTVPYMSRELQARPEV